MSWFLFVQNICVDRSNDNSNDSGEIEAEETECSHESDFESRTFSSCLFNLSKEKVSESPRAFGGH